MSDSLESGTPRWGCAECGWAGDNTNDGDCPNCGEEAKRVVRK